MSRLTPLVEALATALRRGGAEVRSRLDQGAESGAVLGGLGAFGLGGPGAGFEALDRASDHPYMDGDYTDQRNMAAAGGAYGGAAGFGLGALFGGGRRGMLRSMLSRGGQKAMREYIRYLRSIGFDEEASAADFAKMRARSSPTQVRAVDILSRLETATDNGRARARAAAAARREDALMRPYIERAIRSMRRRLDEE